MRKKQKSSVICTGCEKRFCKEHHQEHRKSIEKEFDGLIEQHNLLRQNLYNESNNDNSKTSKLLKIIDDWEKDMIKNIKATAATNKTRLAQIMNNEKDQLKNKFSSMADELKTNQSNKDYVETDIQEWQRKMSECKQKLEQLQTWNNDFINIDIKSVDWNNSIQIHQRKDVLIRTIIPAPNMSALTRKERSINCLYCEKSFYRSSGYSTKFCSQDCEVTYDVAHNPENSSSDGGDGCFHGPCIVLLANGLTKLVKDIRKGDVVKTPDGLKATVTYVIKILRKNKKASMVSFDNGLIITPWHPIRINGKWTFPHDIGRETIMECEEVYNFALDVGHIMIINGIECVTLGHNFKGDVIEHTYFGTDEVLDDMRAMDVSNDGFIELQPNSTVRDRKTGLVSGICRYATASNVKQPSTSGIIPYNECS
jgi:hypothetical protein